MPFNVKCLGCGTSKLIDCTCPAGYDPAKIGEHLAGRCEMASPDAAVVCAGPLSADCCKADHDHAQPCPGQHEGETCPEPDTCRAFAALANTYTAGGEHPLPDGFPDSCPGGHCHKDLASCTGCRALDIEIMAGSITMQRTSA